MYMPHARMMYAASCVDNMHTQGLAWCHCNGVGGVLQQQPLYGCPGFTDMVTFSGCSSHAMRFVHCVCVVQVQGVLSAAAESWPHIHISDSLVMADAAVAMARAGCSTIAVLGVDFMSENVRAILDESGLQDVQVGHQHSTAQHSSRSLPLPVCLTHTHTHKHCCTLTPHACVRSSAQHNAAQWQWSLTQPKTMDVCCTVSAGIWV